MIIALITFLIAFTVFLVWNLISTSRHIKHGTENIQDSKYWELKYKIEYLIAVTSVIVIVSGFLGYQLNMNIRTDIDRTIDEQRQRVSLVDQKLLAVDDKISTLNKTSSKLDSFQRNQDVKLSMSNVLMSTLERKIKEASESAKLTYVVTLVPLKYYNSETQGLDTVFFRDLKVNGGNPLPAFRTPPSVIAISHQGVMLITVDVTNSYAVLLTSMVYGDDIKKPTATLIIVEN